MFPRRLTMYAALLVLLIPACGGGNSALNPRFQPEVNNAVDNFQFQSTGVQNVTETLNYTWQNTGTRANVNQACAITSGSAFLHIADAQGANLYSGDLRANGTFTTVAGQTGDWRIQVVLDRVSGTLNFRVQKNP